jgi:serine protease
LAVSDAWVSTSPGSARAKISWSRPSLTYGATVVGYKIESSSNKSNWKTLVSNTKSTSTSTTLDKGLSGGAPTYFRVSAITKKGSTLKVGKPSPVIARTFSTAPQAPVLLGLTKVAFANSSHVVRWLPQTPSQKGSSTTSYKVTAKSSAGTDLSCSATANNFCTLSDLVAGATYSISLVAKNSRGSEINIDQFQAQDADISLQWYLGTDHGIAATRAWTATRGSNAVVVAVLDSGITAHTEFDGQVVDGYDFVSDKTKDGDTEPGRDLDPTDPGDGVGTDTSSWHGTHVAGIIGAKSDLQGISGIAPNAKIQPIRVLGVLGEGSSIDLALAIRWAAGQDLNGFVINGETLSDIPVNKTPAKVINMSMAFQPRAGTNDYAPCPSIVQAAVDYAQSKGVTLVAAAGNGDTAFNPVDNSRVYPTNCAGPLSVGSIGFTGDVAFYSNFGVDLVAPGGDQRAAGSAPAGSGGMIYSTSNSGTLTAAEPNYRLEQGTSMAAPVAAGIIALMYSLRPNIDVKIVWEALKASVRPFPAGTKCAADANRCGIGSLNAATALEALIAITG